MINEQPDVQSTVWLEIRDRGACTMNGLRRSLPPSLSREAIYKALGRLMDAGLVRPYVESFPSRTIGPSGKPFIQSFIYWVSVLKSQGEEWPKPRRGLYRTLSAAAKRKEEGGRPLRVSSKRLSEPVRGKILIELKKRRPSKAKPMTMIDLSATIESSRAAILRHMDDLESQGVVVSTTVTHGRGRPWRAWYLSPRVKQARDHKSDDGDEWWS